MYKIEYSIEKALYNVVFDGEILESFITLWEALDYKACMLWERDNAFNDYGCEYDIEEY